VSFEAASRPFLFFLLMLEFLLINQLLTDELTDELSFLGKSSLSPLLFDCCKFIYVLLFLLMLAFGFSIVLKMFR